MNAKDIEDLFRLFQQMSMNRDQNRDYHAYRTQQEEIEYHVKFSSWIKQTYPDVWEAWRALQDLENSTKVEVAMQSGWNRN